jgi:acetyltransferase-like isoleucine patch superfamily enzyme
MPFPTTLLSDGNKSMIEIGDNCRVNGAYIHAQKRIKIGKNCVIAAGVNIIDSNGHELYSHNRTNGRDTAKKIMIGENVWIGLNAIILKNTHIGDNSVIAAGSVVKGHFPANSLIQGNPAVIVKQLEIN